MKKIRNPYQGGKFKAANLDKFFGEPKKKIILNNEQSKIREKELKDKDWYVLDSFHGTPQEIALIDFIKDRIGNLQEKYNELYLFRNEEVYKIYDFKKGRGFQPDFIMFLRSKKQANLYYQVFIEPKGDGWLDKDSWKNDF